MYAWNNIYREKRVSLRILEIAERTNSKFDELIKNEKAWSEME